MQSVVDVASFSAMVAIYFETLPDAVDSWPEPCVNSAVIKVIPVFYLLCRLLMTQCDDSEARRYRAFICAGLFCSIAGDIALVWPADHFTVGIVCFGLCHVMYRLAFDFKADSPLSLVLVGVMAALPLLYLVPHLQDDKEEVSILALVCGYNVAIIQMTWHAVSSFAVDPSVRSGLACVGAVVFCLSDFLLAIDRWVGTFYSAPMCVMVTYYAAQLHIALSATVQCMSKT